MESNRKFSANQSDEIDVVLLLSKFVLAVRKNVALIIIALLIGVGLGFLYYKMSPKVYESTMLVSSEILTESHSQRLIENLTKLIRENNYQALSKKLTISPDQAAKLSDFEVKNVTPKEVDITKLDLVDRDRAMYLSVQARTTDNASWKDLEKGLTEYLRSSEYVGIRVKQKAKFNNELIRKIELELIDLEKLKSKTSSNDSQSSKDNLFYIDPASINSTIIALNKEKLKLQNSLENVESVQVVEGFTVFENPASPKLSISLSAGLSVSVFLIVILFVTQAVRAIIKLEPKSGQKV